MIRNAVGNVRWWEIPGVIAAYQAIGAPSQRDSYENVGKAMAGRYVATPGVAPTWHGATGWGFNGSTQYLTVATSPVVATAWTMILRCSVPNITEAGSVFAIANDADQYVKYFAVANFTKVQARSGNAVWTSADYGRDANNHVWCITEADVYKDGYYVASIVGGSSITGTYIGIGALRLSWTILSFINCTVQAAVICSRTLSPAEVWHASRQMAYCDVNPDWNAWAPRRRYWYAPLTLLGNKKWILDVNCGSNIIEYN